MNLKRRNLTPTHRRGFLYAEVLMYMGLLSMFSVLAYQTYYQAERQAGSIQRNSREISEALYAGERWRADVRQATAEPEWIPSGWRKAMVMRLTTPTGNIDYYFSENQVWRKAGDGTREPVMHNVKQSRMISEMRGAVSVVRWELEILSPDPLRAKLRPQFTFLAVPNLQSTP